MNPELREISPIRGNFHGPSIAAQCPRAPGISRPVPLPELGSGTRRPGRAPARQAFRDSRRPTPSGPGDHALRCPWSPDGRNNRRYGRTGVRRRSLAAALRRGRSGRARCGQDGAVGGVPAYWWLVGGAGRPSGQVVLAAPFAGASGLGFCCLVPVGVCGNGVRDGGPGGECFGESGGLEDAQDMRGSDHQGE